MKRRYIIWAALALVSLGLFFLLRYGDNLRIGDLTPQLAAERWETAEKPYAMVSVFLDRDNSIPQGSLGEIYLNVENALTAGGVGSEDYPWFYGASYQTDATLYNGKVSGNVELTAVAGDFFRIHPMTLLTGWYMTGDEVMHDRIILDRQTAWNLFASENVAGMAVELNGARYVVAAVVDLEPGNDTALAAGTTARAWVYADSPGLATDDGESAPGFTCMEMVLPQPVKDFAATTMKSALQSYIPETTLITDNSARFSLKNRWDVLRSIGSRGVSSDTVPYPYWENAAYLAENGLSLRLIPEGLLLLFPAVSLIILLLWLNHKRTWGFHSIREGVETLVDRKRQKDYYAKYPEPSPDTEWDEFDEYEEPDDYDESEEERS